MPSVRNEWFDLGVWSQKNIYIEVDILEVERKTLRCLCDHFLKNEFKCTDDYLTHSSMYNTNFPLLNGHQKACRKTELCILARHTT